MANQNAYTTCGTIGDRMKEIRKCNNMSMEKFGSHIGMQKSAISRLESGAYNPSEQTILITCEKFGINRQWLETGEGEMLKHNESDNLIPRLQQLLANYPALAKALGTAISVMTEADFARLNEIIDLCTKKQQP